MNIKPIILLLAMLLPNIPLGAQTASVSNLIKEAHIYLNLEKIDQAFELYSKAVNQSLQNRSSGSGVDGELLAEYAYVLALHHDFEISLMYLDRARALNASHKDFYSSQIMSLLCYDKAAEQLMKTMDGSLVVLNQKGVPNWINGIYQRLTPQCSTHVSLIRESPQNALKRANRLLSNGQIMQSMAIFEELSLTHSGVFSVFIDYSALWERLGRTEYAIFLLQKGIDMMPSDTALDESKNELMNHLTSLRNNEQPTSSILPTNNFPRLMVYAGASAAKEQFSLNGRIGMYTTNKFSASLNMGLGWLQDTRTGNLGLSAYKSWKFLVFGLGVSDQFSQETHTVGLSPSIGLSFMNKAQTSSFDVTLGGIIPFSQEQKFSWNISIGTTIYTDVKGGKK